MFRGVNVQKQSAPTSNLQLVDGDGQVDGASVVKEALLHRTADLLGCPAPARLRGRQLLRRICMEAYVQNATPKTSSRRIQPVNIQPVNREQSCMPRVGVPIPEASTGGEGASCNDRPAGRRYLLARNHTFSCWFLNIKPRYGLSLADGTETQLRICDCAA